MIIRDYLICLLQMYLLEDLEKNILPYRRERFWEKFLVYCIAALAMFGTNRLESSILNMVMIPVIYMIASMVVFRGNIWKKLVTVCCYYVLAIIPEFLFAALTNAYGVTGASEGFRTETEKTLALLLMSTMTFLFIKCINQVTRKRDYLTIENKTFTVLLMLPTATIIILGCVFYSNISFEGMNRVMVPVGASLLLMTNIFIFTVFDRFVEKSEEVKKMDRLYQKSRAEIANLQYMNKPDATEEEVYEAAKKARCYDFIMALPDGFQTVIGEGGATLSGGEKQRISIARCILKDAPIVILDEATASVDTDNESYIQEAINELVKGKTLLVIAHRLNTIRQADQILVISDGRISEQGTHDELMAKAGIYQDFVNIRKKASGWSLA